jgi:hypothetical protein
MSARFQIAVRIVGHQAIDKRVKQFLLECSRDFGIPDQLMSRFGETTGPRMKPQQARCGAPRWSQNTAGKWWSQLGSSQGLAAGGKLFGRQ